MARERRLRSEEAFPEPDMLPLMNIILMLILALITMSALLPLGFISSESQRLARGLGAMPQKAEERKPLDLILFITESGFNISVHGNVLKDSSGKPLLIPKVALADGTLGLDYKALNAKLTEIKKIDQEEESLRLTADPEIKFDAVIQVMDAARFDAEKHVLFPKISFAAGIVG